MINWAKNASRSTIAGIAIALAIVLFLCINLIVSLTVYGVRLDVTDQQIYTLTDATREILRDVEEPITIRLYLSSSLVNASPDIRLHSERVIELLKTYENVSGGMVDFQQFDPVSLSVEEDEALGYGLVGVQLSLNDRAYFGLVATNSIDDIEVIPFLSPDATAALEYDLTRIVSHLSNRAAPAIGLISGLSLEPDGGGPYQFYQRLLEEFAVATLPPDINNIPPEFDAIIVIHPAQLFEPTRYAIEQYIMRGGNALIFLDTLAEQGPPHPQNPQALAYPDSYLQPLLQQWGVELANDLVVGDADPERARVVQATDGRQFLWPERMDARNFDPNDLVTAPLRGVAFVSPGALSALPGTTTTFTPLIWTSDRAGFIPQQVAMQQNPPASQQAFVPSGRQVLAARVTGTITTAYPDGPPQQAEGADAPPELIRESQAPIDVIIVADTDLIADDYFNGQYAGDSNEVFVINAIEQLAGAANLTALRGRQAVDRPFTYIEQLLADANAEFGDRITELTTEYNDLNLATADLLARTPLGQATQLPADLRAQYDEMVARQVEVQRERRDLQAAVRAEFETLNTNLRLINILTVPAIVILFGILVALWRRWRLARYLRTRQAA